MVFWPRPMTMLAVFLATGLAWLWLTLPLVRAIPREVRSMGALVRRCEVHRERFRENRALSREQVREKVVGIIVEQLGVKPEDCREEARFVADLGCD